MEPSGMQIKIAVIGKIKEKYLRDAIEEYRKRISGFCTLEISEHPEVQPAGNDTRGPGGIGVEKEGVFLLSAACEPCFVFALDPAGIQMESKSFAEQLHRFELEGPYRIVFLIGGPNGLSDSVRSRADMLLSLSKMTFPHQVARLILLEQIYRSFTINRGLPYHR